MLNFEAATKFTGMVIAMLSSIALLATGVITESVWQHVMLGSFLIFAGADVGEFGLAVWQRVSADRRQAEARDK